MLHQEISSHKENKVPNDLLECGGRRRATPLCAVRSRETEEYFREKNAAVASLCRCSTELPTRPIFGIKKKREEKWNSPPGLTFGLWLQKVFGAVKRTNALVLLFLR
jgi:hypothetical protein